MTALLALAVLLVLRAWIARDARKAADDALRRAFTGNRQSNSQ